MSQEESANDAIDMSDLPTALNISWSLDPDQQTIAKQVDQSGYLPIMRLSAARYLELCILADESCPETAKPVAALFSATVARLVAHTP